jgi:hypothetical protein
MAHRDTSIPNATSRRECLDAMNVLTYLLYSFADGLYGRRVAVLRFVHFPVAFRKQEVFLARDDESA